MKIDLSVSFIIINLVCLTIILIEFIYSAKKGDNIYSIEGTKGNVLSFAITNIISKIRTNYNSLVYVAIFSYFGYTKTPFSFLSFVTCLIIIDFIFYILHFIKHKLGFLWMFHHVHHSDNKFNASTFLRTSWFEMIFFISVPLFILSLLGFSTYTAILASQVSFIFQFLAHSQYIKFPNFMSYVFITPQIHKIHHDQEMGNQNSNFGAMFSFWDRLFGTYTPSINNFTPGIKGYSQNNFIKMQTEPIVNYFNNKL